MKSSKPAPTRTPRLTLVFPPLTVPTSLPLGVAIPKGYIEQLPIGAMLGRYVLEQLGLKVYFGGSRFTEGVEHFMQWYPQAAHVVVTGDGELPLRALLQTEDQPASVAGAFYREAEQIVKVPASF